MPFISNQFSTSNDVPIEIQLITSTLTILSIVLFCDILEPYSEYKITVKAFTWKNEGEASDAVTQRTDISGPSAPIVSNLTCHNLDALYLRWKRPAEYYNTIDYYIVRYGNLLAL